MLGQHKLCIGQQKICFVSKNHGCNPNPNPRASKPNGIRVTAGCLPQSVADVAVYRSVAEKCGRIESDLYIVNFL